jgi:ABC-2 type transport system ATP-binding protein
MKAYEAIAFPRRAARRAAEGGRRRANCWKKTAWLCADRQIRQLSKGMAQQVQLLGTLVHRPTGDVRRTFLRPRRAQSGQAGTMIRGLAEGGTTVIFSTHVIAHAERLCDEVAIIAGGRVPFAGPVDARATASPAGAAGNPRR